MINGKRKFKGGKFDRPTVDGGRFGAASIALRYDTLDLGSGSVAGGNYEAFVLGADWWPKDFLRIGLNGFIANADLGASVSGLDAEIAAAVTAGAPRETVQGVTLRAQFDFKHKLF